ncbi:hypothetical protein RGQ29_012685 [Quercus rubra]|uniref:ABC transporter domain-containing protein n=1 Tax=Quercus rubra TaxID=3512 RepID=A0AAN7J430_QUERU|nr:hypothetical protein RGQ29_012685 [Quercus rubra]
MLVELLRREKELNIKPDPFIDALMKLSVLKENKEDIVTDYVLKILGLDVCADTIVGNEMIRGISGGQKRRVTTGEMLVGPSNAFFMDNISNDLDNSTTFQIINSIRQSIHIFNKSALIFFQVSNMKDQRQYWVNEEQPYHYVSVNKFAEAFKSFRVGRSIQRELATPFNRSKSHPAALTRSKYGANMKELMKACFSREVILMKRSVSMYLFRAIQLEIIAIIAATVFAQAKKHHDTLEDGIFYLGALYFGLSSIMFAAQFELPQTIDKLPVFYKQRDLLFYPSWAFSLPVAILGIPLSLIDVVLWDAPTYFLIGFDPSGIRWLRHFLLLTAHAQMSYALFRCMGALSRDHVIANTAGSLAIICLLVFSGFTISRTNEFLGRSWKNVRNGTKEALGMSVLKARGLFTSPQWPWIGLFALIEYGKVQGVSQSKNTSEEKHTNRISETEVSKAQESGTSSSGIREANAVDRHEGRGMPLPFAPISLTFEDIRYSVTMPKSIELRKGVSGAFRPGVLTALMGISGAGKTTLLDGNITTSGYPNRQETFARVSGYCEQNDIHSPLVTVYESLLYSAWLRLPPTVHAKTTEVHVEGVMELVELTTLRDALIGFPNVTELSTDHRKRLTIAVELVAKPSIIFMDEPTTGTVRNMVDTGRTVVCTIHQPSNDIFESFDELILLTQGGEEIYVGLLGPGSCHLINYFQEQTTREKEEALGVKFADVYRASDLFRRNKALIRELSTPPPDSQKLHFPSKYSRSFFTQCIVCLWKQHKLYWRNTPYNAVRLLFGISQSILCGILFWGLGTKRTTEQGIFSGLGALYTTLLFLGFNSATAVQLVIVAERTIYYKERAARMYSALPYAMAQEFTIQTLNFFFPVAIEIPYTFATVFMNSVIVYPMIGYEWTSTKFFHYLFYQFFTVLSLIYYGMMVIGISPNLQVSFVISGALYTTWNLFTGFVIPQKRIAIWWRWFAWISPVSWGFNGLATSLYGDVKNKLDSGETVAEFIKDYFGFRHDLLWVVCLALIGSCVFFVPLFVASLKILNFQKR